MFSETGVAYEQHTYGDLLLTPEQEKLLLIKGSGGSEKAITQGFLVGARIWPDGIVPFELDRRLSKLEKIDRMSLYYIYCVNNSFHLIYCIDSQARSAISEAMNELAGRSCLQFVERARYRAPNYIYITPGAG